MAFEFHEPVEIELSEVGFWQIIDERRPIVGLKVGRNESEQVESIQNHRQFVLNPLKWIGESTMAFEFHEPVEIELSGVGFFGG